MSKRNSQANKKTINPGYLVRTFRQWWKKKRMHGFARNATKTKCVGPKFGTAPFPLCEQPETAHPQKYTQNKHVKIRAFWWGPPANGECDVQPRIRQKRTQNQKFQVRAFRWGFLFRAISKTCANGHAHWGSVYEKRIKTIALVKMVTKHQNLRICFSVKIPFLFHDKNEAISRIRQ